MKRGKLKGLRVCIFYRRTSVSGLVASPLELGSAVWIFFADSTNARSTVYDQLGSMIFYLKIVFFCSTHVLVGNFFWGTHVLVGNFLRQNFELAYLGCHRWDVCNCILSDFPFKSSLGVTPPKYCLSCAFPTLVCHYKGADQFVFKVDEIKTFEDLKMYSYETHVGGAQGGKRCSQIVC